MRGRTLQHVLFFILLFIITVAFIWLIRAFIEPILWAAILAIIFRPIQKRWLRVFKNRVSTASLFSLITIIFIVIIPLSLLGVAVSNEAINLYEGITEGRIDVQKPIQMMQQAVPVLNEFLERFGIETERIRENLSNIAVTASQYLASQTVAIGQNTLRITALFFIMLYLLFFFLRDGDRLIDSFVKVLPLGDERERRLFSKFAEVSRATIKGTLVVGVIQGALGGFIFWVLGISAPIFWAVLMTVLSLLPAIGAAIIWFPAAVILIVTGSYIKGLILLAFGTGVISLVDNFLRPVLVGRDTRMPDYLVLLSTLGGLAVFGISGFVIGPVIAALTISFWQMFEEEYAVKEDAYAISPPVETPPTDEADYPLDLSEQEQPAGQDGDYEDA